MPPPRPALRRGRSAWRERYDPPPPPMGLEEGGGFLKWVGPPPPIFGMQSWRCPYGLEADGGAGGGGAEHPKSSVSHWGAELGVSLQFGGGGLGFWGLHPPNFPLQSLGCRARRAHPRFGWGGGVGFWWGDKMSFGVPRPPQFPPPFPPPQSLGCRARRAPPQCGEGALGVLGAQDGIRGSPDPPPPYMWQWDWGPLRFTPHFQPPPPPYQRREKIERRQQEVENELKMCKFGVFLGGGGGEGEGQ